MSAFLSYEGIKGESSDKGHKEWIDVETWKWGTHRQITSASSTQGDRESSNARIVDLIITKKMDSATPKLFLESCCGTGKTVVLRLTKTGSGDGADVFMEYTLKNALISEYKVGGSRRLFAGRPQEIITISFVDLETRYTPYDQDGNPLAPSSVAFDTATNKKR